MAYLLPAANSTPTNQLTCVLTSALDSTLTKEGEVNFGIFAFCLI